MLGRIIAAIIGSRIDRRDGDSGIKGAIIGATLPGLLRRLGPLGLILGGAYVAKRYIDGRNSDPTRPA